jgi:hypothetical protein
VEMIDAEQNNVVPLFGLRNAEDQKAQEHFDRLALMLRWLSEMRRAGYMPPHVARASHEHFTEGPLKAPDAPSTGLSQMTAHLLSLDKCPPHPASVRKRRGRAFAPNEERVAAGGSISLVPAPSVRFAGFINVHVNEPASVTV